jgi:hypothetical protein
LNGDNIATIRSAVAKWARSLQSTRKMHSDVERSPSSFESGLIEFVCDSHESDDDGPTVTPLRVGWGYCPGPGTGRHTWRQIEPTTRVHLERYALQRKGLPPGSRL